MGVKYKYSGEAEIKSLSADSYKLVRSIEPGSATLWDVVGRIRHVDNDYDTFWYATATTPGGSETPPEVSISTRDEYVKNYAGFYGERYQQYDPTNNESESIAIASRKWTLLDGSEVSRDIKLMTTMTWEDFLAYLDTRAAIVPGVFLHSFRGGSGFTLWQWTNRPSWVKPSQNIIDKTFPQIPWYEEPVIEIVHPKNGNKLCTLKLYNGGAEIYSETRSRCPQYVEEFEPEECPSETCPVDCETHFCCYGSNGISVYSFLK